MKNYFRAISIFLIAFVSLAAFSQPVARQALQTRVVTDSIAPVKKWFVSKYVGMETSIGFINGNNFAAFSTPVGLQLNRRLSQHWYAFAGLSIVPTWLHSGSRQLVRNDSKNSSVFSTALTSPFQMNPAAQVGLMYVNEKKTFAISGSFSVRQYNPLMPFSNQGGMIPAITQQANRMRF